MEHLYITEAPRKYDMYLRGRKLKACVVEALAELEYTPSARIIRGSSAWLVSRWVVAKGFVVETLTTPPGFWRVEYAYAITDAGRQYLADNLVNAA